MSSIIQDQILSQTEMDLLVQVYQNPVVVKHLQIMAQNDIKELVNFSALGTDRDIAIAHATTKGRLTTIQALLDIAEQE